jgi:glycosyltransferase involved in cell wall biosynthesis
MHPMPRILFIHNGTPGRFNALGAALRAQGWTGALINGPLGADLAGHTIVRWSLGDAQPGATDKATRRFEAAVMHGRAAAVAGEKLKETGFVPDVIVGHPGWGEMLFLHEVFPGVPQIQVGEYYYHSEGADANFDPEFPNDNLETRIIINANNAALAMSYAKAAHIVVPTPFQASLMPEAFQSHVRIIHEGIDVEKARRRPLAPFPLLDDRGIAPDAPLVTFVNRRYEPLRGVHVFMRALPQILAESPRAQVLMVGSDETNVYGTRAPGNARWRDLLTAELGDRVDWSRVHILGRRSYDDLITIFSRSAAHVYFTYPFVLSWSLLDAMACEALVIGSDTAPVRDVIRHGENGLLVNFFDVEGLARTVVEACADPARFAPIRRAARATVVNEYDQAHHCLPEWISLVQEAAGLPQASI